MSCRHFTAREPAGCFFTRLIRELETLGFRQVLAVIGNSANTASVAVHAATGFRLIRHVSIRRLQARAMA